MSHSRAKLNPYGRRLLCERIQAGFPVRVAARMVGISHAGAYVIWHRYTAEGEGAFELRSSRPRRIARRTAASVERRIERERRRRRWGPLRLSWLLGLARSTIYAVLRRLGLARGAISIRARRRRAATSGRCRATCCTSTPRSWAGCRWAAASASGNSSAPDAARPVGVLAPRGRRPHPGALRRAPAQRRRPRLGGLLRPHRRLLRRSRGARAPGDDRRPHELPPGRAVPRGARGLGHRAGTARPRRRSGSACASGPTPGRT